MAQPVGVAPVSAEAATRLSVRGVSKTFGRNTVLADFEIDIRAGEVHSLVGHNGSGKSTFVKILAGYHLPDPGALGWIDGQEFTLGDARSAAGAGLRFVHQDLGLVEGLDSVDNLFLDAPLPLKATRNIDWASARQTTRELLALLDFEFDVTRPVRELSLTQRTALAVARAIRPGGARSRVVVLDEPTAALPARDVDTLFGVIRALQRQGLGVLFISHHLEEIFGLGGRVSVLRDGRRVTTAAVDRLDEAALVNLMVGDVGRRVELHASRPEPRSSEPILEVRSLSAPALHQVGFEVRPGEVVGVAGVDGSGRENLAMALYGGVGRTGVVMVAGRQLPPGRPDLAARRGVGFVPADRAGHALLSDMSVTSNLSIARLRTRWRGLRIDHSGEVTEAKDWTRRLAIRPSRPETPIAVLSGGNQQKVVFARWLRTSPRVLILDEPTKGVDVTSVTAIWDLVLSAAGDGAAVLVCSSDTEELVDHCHRVLVLRRGQIAAVAQGDQLQSAVVDAIALSGPT
jgi:ribose transport system ATP-binding protein